jgi:hypothetical protein
MMIVAYFTDTNYRILWFKDFGISSGVVLYIVTGYDGGQPFSLVLCDSSYIWAVGRAEDSSGREQAFHHLKLKKDDGIIDSAIYK